MPAKKNRPPTRLEIQLAFAADAEADRLVREWHAKCLISREAGRKSAEQKAAERRARMDAMRLKPRAPRRISQRARKDA